MEVENCTKIIITVISRWYDYSLFSSCSLFHNFSKRNNVSFLIRNNKLIFYTLFFFFLQEVCIAFYIVKPIRIISKRKKVQEKVRHR